MNVRINCRVRSVLDATTPTLKEVRMQVVESRGKGDWEGNGAEAWNDGRRKRGREGGMERTGGESSWDSVLITQAYTSMAPLICAHFAAQNHLASLTFGGTRAMRNV